MRAQRAAGGRAMTLVELVVVLALVGILAALSIPAGTWVLERARKAGCLGHLRQIGAGLENYRTDNNGFLPEMKAMRADKTEDLPVPDTVLLSYVDGPDIFKCPADRNGVWERSGCSYWYHEGVTIQADGTHNYRKIDSAVLGTRDPSKIPLILDKEGFHPPPAKINSYYADGHAGPLFEIVAGAP